MLKCITFDGDASTLNTLMGYLEKLDKALADVHPSAEQGANRTPHLRPGGQQDHSPSPGRDPFPRGIRRLCKGTPYQWQAPAHASQLEAVRGVSGQESFLPGTSFLHRIPLPH